MSVSIESAMLSTYNGGNMIDPKKSPFPSCLTEDKFLAAMAHLPNKVKEVVRNMENYLVMGGMPSTEILTKYSGQHRIAVIYPDDTEGATLAVCNFSRGSVKGASALVWVDNEGTEKFTFKDGIYADKDYQVYVKEGVNLTDDVINRIALFCLDAALTLPSSRRDKITQLAIRSLIDKSVVARDQLNMEKVRSSLD